MKIICVGDSITGHSELSQYLKWSHVLECMCDARFGMGHHVVINRGIGGNTTRDLRARLQADVLDEKPDVVVLMIGGNDADGVDRAETTQNLEWIVSNLQSICPKLLMLQYHVLPDPERPGSSWDHLDDNNDIIAAVAQEHALPVLNMGALMTGALAQHRRDELVSAEDGVHLNPGGELVFARGVFGKLDELEWL